MKSNVLSWEVGEFLLRMAGRGGEFTFLDAKIATGMGNRGVTRAINDLSRRRRLHWREEDGIKIYRWA